MQISNALSPGVRRFVALGLLVVLLGGVVNGVVRPLLSWSRSAAEGLADLRFEAERARRALALMRAAPEPRVVAAQAEVNSWLTPGASDAEAALHLQTAVEGVFAAAGLAPESQRAVPSTPLGLGQLVALDWRGTGGEAQVMQAMAALEQMRPLLRIDRMSLRALDQTSSLPGTPERTRLELDVRIVAFWAPPVSAESAHSTSAAQPLPVAKQEGQP